MTDDLSRGLYQTPPPIEVDYAALREQWRNMPEGERLAAMTRYLTKYRDAMAWRATSTGYTQAAVEALGKAVASLGDDITSDGRSSPVAKDISKASEDN